MCGRYALHAQPEVIALQFGLAAPPVLAPSYNVAPGTRVLVVAGRKQPWYIRPADAPLFGFAAIYTLHRTEQGDAGTVAILTTGANASTRDIYDRMPVILRPEDYSRWLDPAAEPQALLPLLGPYAPERVALHPVSPRVNAVRNDDESCIAPL